MATNPTIKAVVTAEDKASGVVNKFADTLQNVGKRAQTAGLLSENFHKSFMGLTGAVASGSGRYDELNAQLQIVRQRMAEADASGKMSTSSMMGLELQAARLQSQMGRLGTVQQTTSVATQQSSLSFRNMAGAVALGQAAVNVMSGALNKLEMAGKAAVGGAASFEGYRVSFEAMLGSADLARDMLSRLSDFALHTPFTVPGVMEGAKQIMAYGVSADQVIPTMQVLGDVAAGVGMEKLPRLTLALGQITAAQRLYATELRQLTEAGVPIINELVKVTGRGASQIRDDMEKGVGPSLQNVRQALFNMTQEGGIFFNLARKQSETFAGTLSNLSDQAGRTARSMLGISESGDIKQGGPFYYLKEGALAFLNFIQSNSGTIMAVFQGIMNGIITTVSGIKQVIDFLGPSFLITAVSATAFGTALLGLVRVGSTVLVAFRTFGAFLMGPLGAAILGVSILAGVIFTNALKKLHGQIAQTTVRAVDYSKMFKIDMPSGMAASSAGAEKLAKKIDDINQQIEKSNREFRESLADMVKSSQDKVTALTKQLQDENSQYADAQAEKEASFKESQDKMDKDHQDRLASINDKIDKEVRMGVLGDQYKLTSLRQELADEDDEYTAQLNKNNSKYQKDAANAKKQHEEKVSDLQKQLDKETQLLQRHADDIKSIRNVTLLDEIDKLKRSHDENLKALQQQRDDKSASDAMSGGDAVAANQALAQKLKDQGSLFGDAGKAQGSALTAGFGQALRDAVPGWLSGMFGAVGAAGHTLVSIMQNDTPLVYGFAAAFTALGIAMKFDAIFNALTVGFQMFRLVTIPQTIASITAFKAFASSSTMMGGLVIAGVLADIGLVWDALNKIKGAIKDVNNAAKAANSLANENQMRELQRQASVARAAGDTKKVNQLANAIAALAGGRAAGGPVVSGQSYLVGERGPEIYTPGMSGRVTPNNQITNVSKQQPTINVTINAGAFTGTQLEARKFAIMMMDAFSDAQAARGVI